MLDSSLDHIPMQVECPECHRDFLVHVGLTPDTSNNMRECPHCRSEVILLVPGPIVGGPFSVDA
jgi:hypothetical protein